MMTTCATLLTGVPLALGTGIGSELRQPLTLYTTSRSAPGVAAGQPDSRAASQKKRSLPSPPSERGGHNETTIATGRINGRSGALRTAHRRSVATTGSGRIDRCPAFRPRARPISASKTRVNALIGASRGSCGQRIESITCAVRQDRPLRQPRPSPESPCRGRSGP
jgi:hypothetical protein